MCVPPATPEPSQPILTRWSTRLEAAIYYFKHFESIKSVILQLHAKEAAATKLSQIQFQNPQAAADLQTKLLDKSNAPQTFFENIQK